ncbi:hypothetical protein PoB_006606800 [Plakobranchus ocellatus]|uniref:Uncharacterized protein n=1 Tax=Plakobranchus ocellatus TaxID=259542 RepID=A0AAV4D680_9GAST|nr:hypothetical protein PoB_006606800 [Plakobranchus ocellatus]
MATVSERFGASVAQLLLNSTRIKMGSTASTSHKGMREAVPMWIYTAKLPDDQSNHKFAGMSSGMQQLGPNSVARQRTGKFDTDAARWKEGFSSGTSNLEAI